MTTPIAKFRAKMTNFLRSLQNELTEVQQLKELEKFKITYDLGMRSNPQGTVDLIMKFMVPHADEILRGDEEYFLHTFQDPTGQHVSLLEQVKQWWHLLSTDLREEVKNTLKLLLMLGTLATKNAATLVIINQYRDVDNPLTF
jgi:hypothetical protein